MRPFRAAVLVALALAAAPASAAASPPLSARTTIEPRPAFFGDRVEAGVEVVADGRRVDPGSVRLAADFSPFEEVAPARRERVEASDSTFVRAAFTLLCLHQACAPGAVRRSVRVPALRLTATTRDGHPLSLRVVWPTVVVVPRVAATIVRSSPPFRIEDAVPPPRWRISPGKVEAGLAAIAAACGLGAALLLAQELVGRRHRVLPQAPPLVRALAAVRSARARTEPDRRKALGLLARELSGADGDGLAVEAAELAWSPGVPAPEALDVLVRRTERLLEGER